MQLPAASGMAETSSSTAMIATLLALGLAPTIGMWIGGGWLAALLFAATAAVVTMRALARHNQALRDPDPLTGQLTPQQAIGMLSALRGQPLAASVVARVAEIDTLASTDPDAAYAALTTLLTQAPRHTAALVLCARLAFLLGRADAGGRWETALRVALDTGLNRVAATTFVSHREHREMLALGPTHRAALATALAANGHPDDARWWRNPERAGADPQ